MKVIKGQSTGHITPVKQYVIVLGWLLFLTFLTVLTAKPMLLGLEEGLFTKILINTVGAYGPIALAMIIATVKAVIVIRNFMHMKYESSLFWTYGLYLPIGLFALLVIMSLIDGNTRSLDKGPGIPVKGDDKKGQTLHLKKAPGAKIYTGQSNSANG